MAAGSDFKSVGDILANLFRKKAPEGHAPIHVEYPSDLAQEIDKKWPGFMTASERVEYLRATEAQREAERRARQALDRSPFEWQKPRPREMEGSWQQFPDHTRDAFEVRTYNTRLEFDRAQQKIREAQVQEQQLREYEKRRHAAEIAASVEELRHSLTEQQTLDTSLVKYAIMESKMFLRKGAAE